MDNSRLMRINNVQNCPWQNKNLRKMEAEQSHNFTDITPEFADSIRTSGKTIRYGTSGMRDKVEVIQSISYRFGLAVAELSKGYSPEAIGLIVTASHNHICDNGVKVVNNEAEMLSFEEEQIIQKFINNADINAGFSELQQALQTMFPSTYKPKNSGLIHIGMDNRSHSPEIIGKIAKGIIQRRCGLIDHGYVSTPQLHFFVNRYHMGFGVESLKPTYSEQISSSFNHFLVGSNTQLTIPKIYIDCSKGLGSASLEEILKTGHLSKLKVEVVNGQDSENLNVGCGSDYVISNLSFPTIQEGIEVDRNQVWASLDGDADRSIIYTQRDGKMVLINGSRMAVIFGAALNFLLDSLKETINSSNQNNILTEKVPSWSVGFISTGYSNGSGVKYVQEQLKIPTEITKTGVKHLEKAANNYTFGIYYEANGHGNIHYNRQWFVDLKNNVESAPSASMTQEVKNSFLQLYYFLSTMNNAVGDGVANVLGFVLACSMLKMSADDVISLYKDNKSKLDKTMVKDRFVIQTSSNELRVLEPADLQEQMDTMLAGMEGSRCFVRPSGTEDIVRIYAEGPTEEVCETIVTKIKEMIAQNPLLQFEQFNLSFIFQFQN